MSSVSVLTLADVGRSLVGAPTSNAYRAVLGFFTECPPFDDVALARAIAESPPLTGDQRFDALLAAAAEHVAFHRNLSPPPWCELRDRFLETAWFPVDLPSLRIRALVSSPASFRRRCIFIDRSDLDRV